jgi:flagellar hook-associated protein 2
VTVVGNINGRRAEGTGNRLASKSGLREDGLVISTTAASAGLYGIVSVTLGVGDRLQSLLGDYLDTQKGALKAKENTYKSATDDINKQIERIEARLVKKEEALRAQFTRLEIVLQKYQAQSQYLDSQLAKLSQNWIQN